MNRRRAARFAAIQALYQAEMSGQDIELVINEFQAFRLEDVLEPLELEDKPPDVDRDWFVKLSQGAFDAISDLDGKLEKTLSSGWTLPRLGYLLRAFLRAGAFEILHADDVPNKVAINEYIELAHAFLSKEDAGFLNAVLDRLAAASKDNIAPKTSSDAKA